MKKQYTRDEKIKFFTNLYLAAEKRLQFLDKKLKELKDENYQDWNTTVPESIDESKMRAFLEAGIQKALADYISKNKKSETA